MRKTLVLLLACWALIACKHNSVEFSYSPAQPRAGESVQFSNLSTSGEEWAWAFGDGATSTLKSPTHTFKQPGKYVVTLRVDDKKAWTVAKEVTIYDTVPTFTISDTTLTVYRDYTLTALIYNPYNYEVQYEWYLPEEDGATYAVMTDTALNRSTLHLYFTRPMVNAAVMLDVTLNGVTTHITRTFAVSDRPTNSILIRTAGADYRQRIFAPRFEAPVADSTATELLNDEQDTIQSYNGYDFTLSELQAFVPELQGFHIAARKLYYRANGLWVANIDGTSAVQIDTADCPAMTLDLLDNRIYWANAQGVWYMPLVGSDNNRFVTVPQQLNGLTGVTRLSADIMKR